MTLECACGAPWSNGACRRSRPVLGAPDLMPGHPSAKHYPVPVASPTQRARGLEAAVGPVVACAASGLFTWLLYPSLGWGAVALALALGPTMFYAAVVMSALAADAARIRRRRAARKAR